MWSVILPKTQVTEQQAIHLSVLQTQLGDGSPKEAGLCGDGGQPQQRDKTSNEFSLISFV